MSNLSNRTEHKALTIIAQMVKDFEKLHYLEMTKEDDWDAKQARNLLECIISYNPTDIKLITTKRAVNHY